MAEVKKVRLIAGANGIWTGTERVEPGEPFEVPEAQARHILKKGAAYPAPAEEEPTKAKRGKAAQGSQEADKGAE